LAGIDLPTALTLALTLATALFAITALVMVFGGLYAFINFRRIAREQAEETAKAVAEKAAERVANEYLQANLIEVWHEYVILMRGISDAEANEIATGQQQ
jgi:hypothetical protein